MAKLVVRLSSMGDVVLTLQALAQQEEGYHFLTEPQWASLAQGHPRILRVWTFQKQEGLSGWLRLFSEIRKSGIREVVDAHKTLRTALWRLLNWALSWKTRSGGQVPFYWRSLRKQRLRLWGFFVFKSYWPASWRPLSFRERLSELFGKSEKRISAPLSYLTRSQSLSNVVATLHSKEFFCVMPASHWRTKEWPLENWIALLKESPLKIVLLGSSADVMSRDLNRELQSLSIPVVSGIGRWTLEEVAVLLTHARYLLSVDTGLAHLAEALGTPVVRVWGPTHPDAGFGKQLSESVDVQKSLWCRPCSKSGNFCYRWTDRWACLKRLSVEDFQKSLTQNSSF